VIGRLLLVMAGGFLASAHCIGMCGGFACALAATDRGGWSFVGRQLTYNSGRIFSYAFMGALAGSAGVFLSRLGWGGVTAPQVLSLVAGVIMIGLGLSAMGVIRLPQRWTSLDGGVFAPLFAHFMGSRGWAGHFGAGVANGFLPCGLVYAFLATAAACGDGLHGLLIMVFFGLGTVPAMLLAAGGGRVLSVAARRRVYQTAAVLIVMMGVLTIYRGWPRAQSACPACGDNGHVAYRS